ncbi:MAG TPA: SURF1 family protein [Actinomycetes bacterium]|nr:SURF1 family protein [Actinomycetes bacterium]
MLRQFFSLKWLALSLLVVVCIAAFGLLASWQWSRAVQDAPVAPSSDEPAVPLSSVHGPGQPVPEDATGKRVSAVGTYDGAKQLLVPSRQNGDQVGFWVVTPLMLRDGSTVPVVRGWTDAPADAATGVSSGKVSITGFLEPSETEDQRGELPAIMPAGQIAVVSSAELVSLWPGELIQGFVLLEHQHPASSLVAVEPPQPVSQSHVSVQNLAYAVQWWLFAAFAVFLWVRMFQADWQDRQSGRSSNGSSPEDQSNLSEARS